MKKYYPHLLTSFLFLLVATAKPLNTPDSLMLLRLKAGNDSLKKQLTDLRASVKGLNDSLLSQTAEEGNIYDESAIEVFNKEKDSIYRNSSYGFLKCKKCEPQKGKAQIIRYNRNIFSLLTFWISMLLLALIWFFAIWLFLYSSLCKDGGGKLPVKERAYSYARVQLFWWTMIIFSLYLYFFAFTGCLLPLNMTTIVLLGAGVLVYSGGKIIDRRQKAVLGGDVKEHVTEGLFTDLLSDDNGITIHRFQSLIFNIIFGLGFVIMFLKNVSFCLYPFPEFGEWQFALLGISSLTYLGLKTTENAPVIPKTETTQSGTQTGGTKAP